MTAHWKALNEHEYVKDDFYAIAEEVYLSQKAAFLDLLVRFERPESDQSASLKPPQFSGKYEDWPAFRDLFYSMVDRDSSLEDVERLHYLKTSLTDEASTLIRNLPTTGENYSRAH
ncbi:uncharacterized protein LOC143896041 [Temnothorax americanus]|uniref:uncharacterized protein LOC143896041 n=1 Tax=Temnothorax americanus TaxID=1964332 RepID=UPI004067FCEA